MYFPFILFYLQPNRQSRSLFPLPRGLNIFINANLSRERDCAICRMSHQRFLLDHSLWTIWKSRQLGREGSVIEWHLMMVQWKVSTSLKYNFMNGGGGNKRINYESNGNHENVVQIAYL